MAPTARPTVALAIRGPIARSDLPGLTDRVCGVLHGNAASLLLCDVEGIAPDAVTVDALARLQLGAQRAGCRVVLRNASPELVQLVAFMGLEGVFADD